jgi:hypothetical protein
MAVTEFQSDDDYYRWLANNPRGFVLNTWRPFSAKYVVLHGAWCRHISEPSHENEPGGFTERDYVKVGAADIESLREWSAQHGRPDPSECSHCKPS